MNIIIIYSFDDMKAYSSLKKCCNANPQFCYDYIVRKKMPFEYKGYVFNRIKVNADWND